MNTRDRARTLLAIPSVLAERADTSGGRVVGYSAATGEYNVQLSSGAVVNGLPSAISGIALGDRAIAQGGVMV